MRAKGIEALFTAHLKEEGALAECKRIVIWLRAEAEAARHGSMSSTDDADFEFMRLRCAVLNEAADKIQRGVHMEEK